MDVVYTLDWKRAITIRPFFILHSSLFSLLPLLSLHPFLLIHQYQHQHQTNFSSSSSSSFSSHILLHHITTSSLLFLPPYEHAYHPTRSITAKEKRKKGKGKEKEKKKNRKRKTANTNLPTPSYSVQQNPPYPAEPYTTTPTRIRRIPHLGSTGSLNDIPACGIASIRLYRSICAIRYRDISHRDLIDNLTLCWWMIDYLRDHRWRAIWSGHMIWSHGLGVMRCDVEVGWLPRRRLPYIFCRDKSS